MPFKTALVCDGVRLGYADINASANRIANALLSAGVGRGGRVVTLLPNCAEAVACIYGTLKAGAVFVTVNRTTKPAKLLHILKDCGASALVASAAALTPEFLLQLAAALPSLKLVASAGTGAPPCNPSLPCTSFEEIQDSFPDSTPPQRAIDLDLACLVYTSGSTGDPKGVMSTHDNVLFVANSIMSVFEAAASDVVIGLLPLSFDYGLYQLIMTFQSGGTLVLENSFAYPAMILNRIEQERVTALPGVPTIFAMLLGMDLSPFDLSSLRYITNTAGALPPHHVTAIRERIPHARFFSMYGVTETKRTLILPSEQADIRPGSVGVAIPGTEVWIEDPSGRRLGPGETGELVARGRHVMRGYWNSPELTAARFRPGPVPGERLFYSGDLFRMDQEGFFYFVTRTDDVIKSRGEKVVPSEVETVLYDLAGIDEVAVVGVPDPILGQAIKAFLVTSDSSITATQVIAHCRARLEDFMVPQHVEFMAALPQTASGKISRRDLN